MSSKMRRSASHLSVVESPVSAPVTVGEYLEGWLWGKQSLRPSTHASYETHVRRYLIPHLGSMPLVALSPQHVERMYRSIAMTGGGRGRPLSVSTLHRIHATLMSALNTAARRGLIDRNPAATVELPRTPRARVETWTGTDLARFLAAISEDRLHLLYLLLGLVGLRRGEVVALRWCDAASTPVCCGSSSPGSGSTALW